MLNYCRVYAKLSRVPATVEFVSKLIFTDYTMLYMVYIIYTCTVCCGLVCWFLSFDTV